MYSIKIENKRGDQLQLSNTPEYDCTATGLNPMLSNIITASVANFGGERYVSSRQQKRNVVLTIYVKEPVEDNRINLYNYIKSHDWIRVYFKNNTRDVYIDGYVESFELDHFSQTQTAQVSIICPKPMFLDVEGKTKQLSVNKANFYFPFYADDDNPIVFSYYDDGSMLVINESDDDIGFIYKIQCNGTVINPMLYLEDTREYFKLNGIYYRDTIITINTLNGQKSVKSSWGGVERNIINDLDGGSSWFKLQSGFNHILQTADTGLDDMVSELIYVNEYEGV